MRLGDAVLGLRLHAHRLAAGFAVGFLVSSALVLLSPRQARADHCDGSSGWFVGIMNESSTERRGIGVWGPGMQVSDTSVHCERVSSIYLTEADTQNYVEMGWFEVPSTSGLDIACSYTTGQPRLFALRTTSGSQYCIKDGPNLVGSPGQPDGFRIENSDLDDIFDFYHDGVVYTTSSKCCMNGTGLNLISTERTLQGSAYGDFQTMRYQSGSGWYAWTDAFVWLDIDPGYVGESQGSEDWWKVVTG
jgi:hypothetical protein